MSINNGFSFGGDCLLKLTPFLDLKYGQTINKWVEMLGIDISDVLESATIELARRLMVLAVAGALSRGEESCP